MLPPHVLSLLKGGARILAEKIPNACLLQVGEQWACGSRRGPQGLLALQLAVQVPAQPMVIILVCTKHPARLNF